MAPKQEPLRFPSEADLNVHGDHAGVVLPKHLDLTKKADGEVRAHIAENIKLGLQLTDVRNKEHIAGVSEFIHEVGEKETKVEIAGEEYSVKVKYETVEVAGSPFKDLCGIRHTCRLPIAPDYFLDVLNRLNYTSAVDKYTYLVEELEALDVDNIPEVDWCHVAYTADTIVLPFVFSTREFVTFDFMSGEHGMLVSRSCLHPSYPVTDAPTWIPSNDRRYRVPLMFFNRVLPDPEDPENACICVQFQYSDIGGVVPIANQVDAVQKFGVENIPKMFRTAKQAEKKGLKLGKGTEGYLKDPLHPSWRQEPSEMVPGL